MHFRENWLIFLGIWGDAELFKGFGEQRQNTFGELRIYFQGFGENNALSLKSHIRHFISVFKEYKPIHPKTYFSFSILGDLGKS